MESQKRRNLKLEGESKMACGVVTLQGKKSEVWQLFLEIESGSAVKLIAHAQGSIKSH